MGINQSLIQEEIQSENINTLEKSKFRNRSTGVVLAVESNGDIAGLLHGLSYDDVQVSYPSATVENYAYYLATVLVATIEVTYTTSQKKYLSRARKL